MPTTRARHMITETDDLERALDQARTLWPELATERAALLREVIALGVEQVNTRTTQRREMRRNAVLEGAGSLTGMWQPGDARQLADEWPE